MKQIRWGLLLVLGLLLIVLTACGGQSEESDESGESADNSSETAEGGEQILHLLNAEIIPSMDSSMATDSYAFQFLGATMEGLYRLDEDANPVEGIATEHEVSEDGLTWTFTLREDAAWSNGEPVTANDFVYAWRRAVDPNTGSEYGPYMMNGVVKNAEAINNGEMDVEKLGVEADGEYTLIVELENPTPYFESLTTFPTFYPQHQAFVEEQADNYAIASENLLFNGPFTLEKWTSTSNSWELVKNENYWDKETVQLDELTFEVVKDPQTSVRLYEEGTVDRADLSSDLVDQYSTHEDYEVVPETFVFYLKFNQMNSEDLANENVRAAISRSFNKQALVDEILNDGSLVANGIVPQDFVTTPDGEDFREANGDLVTYDPETAKEYWEKGLSELGKDTVELELLSSDSEESKVMGEYLANQLETNLPGLSIKLKRVPFEQRKDLDAKMDYDIQISSWGPDYLDPYTFLNLFVTEGGNNKMGYSNTEYDQLMEDVATTYATDKNKRYETFLEAEKILFEDAAIAPIYQSSTPQLVSDKLQGVYVNPFGATYEYKWGSVVENE
ncbi:peptide ABC transporter substrate-binding protein [Oceanobacillus halophilus]|uniref:Peptide ABC transporter substrate-binding protein n=1 Tax=Oceanobacillus halophilus TaxID=930130 RepID=A0A495A9G2_9BACI|nr:peptide ABC transporter substrate-binding protein [Oceanobacillus halophilus]RKQ35875.1 peptide ABC transporter substrate-binding protein [Oceanobacillus halophilus]